MQLSGEHSNPADKSAHLEVCGHDSQLVVGGICPLISSSHLGCHACCVCLVLPLHCQQSVLPVLGLIQPPVQIQDAVLQLLYTGSSLLSSSLHGVNNIVLSDVHVLQLNHYICDALNKPVWRELTSART